MKVYRNHPECPRQYWRGATTAGALVHEIEIIGRWTHELWTLDPGLATVFTPEDAAAVLVVLDERATMYFIGIVP